MNFEKIAPYLHDPLILIGFALFLFFGLGRLLLRLKIIPPLPRQSAYRVVRLLLTYGFILALAVVAVGFVLKYRVLTETEQRTAVRLLEQELAGNIEVVSELKENIETILENVRIVLNGLRHPGNRLTSTLFPCENTNPEVNVPASLEYARQQMLMAEEQGLFDNRLERDRFSAVGEAIVGTISRTMPTIMSLADLEGSRYQISDVVWKKHLPILRQVHIVDVQKLQSLYQDMARLRTNYEVSVRSSIEYLNVLTDFFANRETTYTPQRLAEVLATERLFMTVTIEYVKTVVEKLERIEKTLQALTDAMPPSGE